MFFSWHSLSLYVPFECSCWPCLFLYDHGVPVFLDAYFQQDKFTTGFLNMTKSWLLPEDLQSPSILIYFLWEVIVW